MNHQQRRRTQQNATSSMSSKKSNLLWTARILSITLAFTVLSFLTFLITLTSSYWIIISYPKDFFASRHNTFVASSTYGIIWQCMRGRTTKDSMDERKCDYHQNSIYNTSIVAEQTIVGMIRAMHSFSVIFMLLSIITFICGLYSIHDHRYTYKRLTGMIYILTAASLVVCIEVLSTIFRHSNIHLPDIYPPGTTYSFGPCYIIAWLIFAQLLCSSFVFFVCSKKRKGTFDEATEEEALANRPVDLGRTSRS